MRRGSLPMLALASACSRSPGAPPPTVADDSPVPSAVRSAVASPPADVDDRGGAPPEAPLPERSGRFVAVSAREVVDVDTGRAIALSSADGPVRAIAGSFALMASDHRLTAYVLPRATAAWSLPTAAPCQAIAANDEGAFCATPHDVTSLRWSDGRAATYPVPGSSPVTHMVALATLGVVMTEDWRLTVVDPARGAKQLTLPPPTVPIDRSVAFEPLVVSRDGSVYCRVERYADAYGITCHDAIGERFASGPIAHTHATTRTIDGIAVHETQPFLVLERAEIGHLFWSAYTTLPGITYSQASSLRDGHLAGLTSAKALGLLEAPDGALLGILTTHDDGAVSLVGPGTSQQVRWSFDDDAHDDTSDALLTGDRVVMLRWGRIASGSRLECRTLADGALVWKADVAQLDVPHSKYWNRARVFLRGDTVVIAGREAGGSYVQGFDVGTGRRKFAVLRR